MTDTSTQNINESSSQGAFLPPKGYKFTRFLAFALIALGFIIGYWGHKLLGYRVIETIYGGDIESYIQNCGYMIIPIMTCICWICGLLAIRSIVNWQNIKAFNLVIISFLIYISSDIIQLFLGHVLENPTQINKVISGISTFGCIFQIYAAIHIVKNGILYGYFWFIFITLGSIMNLRFIGNSVHFDTSTHWLIIILAILELLSLYNMLKDDNLYRQHGEKVVGAMPLNCSTKEYVAVPVALALFVLLVNLAPKIIDSTTSMFN